MSAIAENMKMIAECSKKLIELCEKLGMVEEEKPNYPKTYEECSKIVKGCRCKGNTGWRSLLLTKLQELLVCRDAFWKIAGEKMGLDKSWEPNWTSFEGYPAIYMYRYQITLSVARDKHHYLVFPTEEMRDAFYENFKELINGCKELL